MDTQEFVNRRNAAKAKMAARNPVGRVRIFSGIGDILARRFEKIGFVPIPGCPCKQVQSELNATSPAAVMSDIDGWATKVQRSARRWKELKGGIWNFIPAPPIWLCKRVIEDAVKEAQGLKSADEDTAL